MNIDCKQIENIYNISHCKLEDFTFLLISILVYFFSPNKLRKEFKILRIIMFILIKLYNS